MKKIKKYTIGFTIVLLLTGTMTYATNNGSLGSLFEQISGSWSFSGENTKEGTLTISKLDFVLQNEINTNKQKTGITLAQASNIESNSINLSNMSGTIVSIESTIAGLSVAKNATDILAMPAKIADISSKASMLGGKIGTLSEGEKCVFLVGKIECLTIATPGCGSDISYVNTSKGESFVYKTKTALDGNCWTSTNMKHTTSVGNSGCYGNSPQNCINDGRLYDFDAANDVCGKLGVGWVLPSSTDYSDLKGLIIGNPGWDGTSAFDGLISVLPGVISNFTNNAYNFQGNYGTWRTSTGIFPMAVAYTASFNNQSFDSSDNPQHRGYSVICIKK